MNDKYKPLAVILGALLLGAVVFFAWQNGVVGQALVMAYLSAKLFLLYERS